MSPRIIASRFLSHESQHVLIIFQSCIGPLDFERSWLRQVDSITIRVLCERSSAVTGKDRLWRRLRDVVLGQKTTGFMDYGLHGRTAVHETAAIRPFHEIVQDLDSSTLCTAQGTLLVSKPTSEALSLPSLPLPSLSAAADLLA
eukprot:COSAG05_NODE_172_length_14980_cov_10.662791_2_plen_144_part_00